jgi:hypothetical protein
VAAIGEWVFRVMGVERKDIPEHRWLANLGEDAPNDSSSALGDDRSTRGAVQCYSTQERASASKVYLIRKRNTRSTPATVTEVTRNPNCVGPRIYRGFQKPHDIAFAQPCCIWTIVNRATVTIRIENRRQMHLSQCSSKMLGSSQGNFSIARV